jgi:5-methylcytosine-specific restriction protein A
MALGGITRTGVIEAIKEHDRVGRDVFLATHGFRPATGFVLVYEGRRYDPKAIAGVAHLYDFGRALKPSEFSSGTGHAVSLLRELGFQVLTFARDFLRRVGRVRPADRNAGQPLHRPLLLLWALGQSANGAPRLHPWSTVRDALVPLLAKYAGADNGAEGALYPFWALERDELWTVTPTDALVMTSRGRRPTLTSLNAANPDGGLLEQDFQVLQASPEVAAEAAAGLILRYFHTAPAGLIEDLGLARLLEHRWADALRPLLGEPFDNRDAIWHAYGGQKMGGIGPLNDGILSAFADEKGPYADGRLPDTGWIGYVGDGLSGDQDLKSGNQHMADYQAAQRPLRYWHKPYGMQFSFETWAVIVQRRMRWGKGEDGAWRREFVWVLAPVPAPDRSTWPPDVLEALLADTGDLYDETADYRPEDIDPTAAAASNESDEDAYRRLNDAAEKRSKQRTTRKKPTKVDRYMRCEGARAAVLRRSGGDCENSNCDGHPKELSISGKPLLQVDHVHDLAKGGEDLPWNMIALCPNCHTLKTLGVNRDKLSRLLQRRAQELHDAALRPTKAASS